MRCRTPMLAAVLVMPAVLSVEKISLGGIYERESLYAKLVTFLVCHTYI